MGLKLSYSNSITSTVYESGQENMYSCLMVWKLSSPKWFYMSQDLKKYGFLVDLELSLLIWLVMFLLGEI